jgi:kumamolisin
MARTSAHDSVATLIFRGRRGTSVVSKHARAVSDPDSPEYGRFLTRAALAREVGPDPRAVRRCQRWARGRDLTWQPTFHPQAFLMQGSRSAMRKALGDEVDEILRHDHAAALRTWPLPDNITPHLRSIVVGGATHEMAQAVKGMGPAAAVAARQVAAGAASQERLRASSGDVRGMTPAEIRTIYDFSPEWTGSGETIVLLNLGARVATRDLQAFWRSHGIDRRADLTEQIDIGRSRSRGFLARLEPTMGAQWIGALAPGARLQICNIDSRAVADPWAAWLAAAIAGARGVHPTIAVSTWSLPERFYYARHGREVITALLEQAAAVGVTVIAASGDWGVYDGRPSSVLDDRAIAEAPWPHGVFPSVEDYVLSVGGTMITSRQPLTELAWSGPLPPNEDLRDAVPFDRLASSGGFAEDVAIPWWQQPTLLPKGRPRTFSRGLNLPAVLPSGRGYPDVALMAQGQAITYPSFPGLASIGFDAIVDQNRLNYAGGTSVAAPVWAAITACVNEALRTKGCPRLGFANPLFYRLAEKLTNSATRPFRPVTTGSSDVELWVINAAGTPVKHLLQGFSAAAGHGSPWNPVTGLGVPNVRNLIAAVTRPVRRKRVR